MRNIFLVCISDYYYKNKIFDLNNPVNRDDFYYPYYLLKKEFENYGVSLNTYDYFDTPATFSFEKSRPSGTESRIEALGQGSRRGSYFNKDSNKDYSLLFFDIPKNLHMLLKYHENIDKFLVIFENKVIMPEDWCIENHKYFKKIFTWNDEFVDGKKYIKFYHPNKITEDLDFDLNKKEKLCTMIVGHKFKSHPLELYTERVKAICWFEKNHPEDFDLYGTGWDRYFFKGIFSRLNRFNFLAKILRPKYPSYKGPIKSKREILQKYKFLICYENAGNIPGYITEKIFGCFFTGCVPIYLGAPNVTDYIPSNTFIDKRNFKTYEGLYNYIKNMPDKEYVGYIEAIKNFIKSDKIHPFSAEYFAQNIVKEVLEKG